MQEKKQVQIIIIRTTPRGKVKITSKAKENNTVNEFIKNYIRKIENQNNSDNKTII